MSDMNGRVSALETEFKYVRRDLDDIKVTLSSVAERLSDLPTKDDLWSWKIQWLILGVTLMALIVGGIIGGLSWIKPDAPVPSQIMAPAPQVIVIPAPQPPPTAAAPTLNQAPTITP